MFALVGMSDAAELRGHRRTYMGAYPGKLVEVLKRTKSSNPVVLLDEVDKLSPASFQGGDPGAALLEVLDPELNREFSDQYLSVPIDLSRILFICTANIQESIPHALRDRMEILQLSGYALPEKMQIANMYLRKKISRMTGVRGKKIDIDDEVLSFLILNYCNESGVRNLSNLLEKLYRKAAVLLVTQQEKKVEITLENLASFIGPPEPRLGGILYSDTRGNMSTRNMPPGVCLGLAWSSNGGEPVYVESIARGASTEGMRTMHQSMKFHTHIM